MGELSWLDYLNSQLERLDCIAARRGIDGKALQETLTEQLQNPPLNMPFALQTLDGKRYYLLERPMNLNGKLKGEFLVDLGSTARPMEIPFDNVDKTNTGRLGHRVLCERVIIGLRQLEEPDWDQVFVELIATIKDESDVDPVIRAFLLKLVLDAGCQGSLRLRSTFGPYQRIVDSIDLDLAGTWLDPDGPATLDRAKAAEIMQRLTPIHAAAVSSAWEDKASDTELPRPLVWVGWARRDRDGGWSWLPGNISRPCYVLGASRDNALLKLVEVGLAPRTNSGLIEGMPVFAIQVPISKTGSPRQETP